MRNVVVIAAIVLAACSNAEKKEAQADAKVAASGFTPPSVTSRLDFGGMVERRFRRLDRDANNAITRDELPSADSRIMNFDSNGDGRVTNEEYGKGMLALFDRDDVNKDGTVTSDERELVRQRQGR
jgi:hypothetical protein